MAEALTHGLGATGSGGHRGRRLAAVAVTAAAAGLLAFWIWTPRPSGRGGGREAPGPVTNRTAPTQPSPTVPLASPAGGLAGADPFVPPLGLNGRLSDAAGRGSNAAVPFSIRAAWHLGEQDPEIELRASLPVSVYVLLEERPSHCFLLFPLPGTGRKNPLAGELTHRLRVALPARPRVGRLLLVAGPSPLAAFEDIVERSRVPRAETEVAGIRLTEEALAKLRGLEPAGTGRGSTRPLFESAPPLASHPEIVQGYWIRRIAVP